MSAEELAHMLEALPLDVRRAALAPVGVRDARRVPASAVAAALRLLSGGDPRRTERFRSILAGFAWHAFGNSDGLGRDDCVALLTETGAADVLHRSEHLRSWAAWEYPDTIRLWSLAQVVQDDRPLAALALGLLAGEAAHLAHTGAAIRSAWERLRSIHPDLPEQPIDARRLCAIARPETTTPPAESELTLNSETSDAATAPIDTEDLAVELGRLRECFLAAADSAERVAGRLRRGERPDDTDLDHVRDAVRDFDTLRVKVAALGGDEPAAELADLERRVHVTSQVERARALAGLRGPEMLAEEIDEIRAMSHGPDAERLVVLAELLDALADGDEDRAVELADRAAIELPDRFRKVVFAATRGRLDMAAEPSPATLQEQETTAQAEPEPEPRPEPEPEPTPEPEPQAEREANGVLEPELYADHESVEPGLPEDDLAELDAIIREATGGQRDDRVEVVTEQSGSPAEESEPVTEPAPPEANERDRREAEEFVEAEVAAIRAGRFGLAAHLREAAGRPEAECNARRCAALASHMALFGQELAGEFTLAAEGLEPKAFADDLGGAMLAWAAGIRAGIVCPTPESTQLVDQLSVFFTEWPLLRECGEAFVQAARSGAYLSPDMDGLIRGAAAAHEERRTAQGEAYRLLTEGPRGKIKFQFATEVFKSLLKKDGGAIGELLAVVAADDASRVAEVGAAAVRLAAPSERDRVIAEAEVRLGRKRNTIIGPARKKVEERTATALAVVDRWVRAVRRHDEQAGDHQDHRVATLRQLRDTMTEKRARITGEFADLTPHAADADPVIRAAAQAAAGLLDRTVDLLDGAPLPT
ncbi:hypothetical protein AB0J52_01585, partial [Spirillospora sp. NPDC049652]